MDIVVGIMLRQLGVLPIYTGYKYLTDAIILGYMKEGSLEHITKDIYPELAQKYHVSIWMIETDIRNAIQRSWKKVNPDKIEKYFPDIIGERRPTNTDFIEGLVTHIRNHNEENWEL